MKTATALLLAVLATVAGACSSAPPPPPPPTRPELPASTQVPSDSDTTEQAIRFLEDKANQDKLDNVARNQLVDYYLQRVRETGNLDYLTLATKAAKESLEAV